MTKMTEAELIKRDRGRNVGEEVLQAIRDIKAGRTGRIFRVEVSQATEDRQKSGRNKEDVAN